MRGIPAATAQRVCVVAAIGWSLLMLAALQSEWSLTNVLVTFGVWLLVPCAFAGLVYVVKKMDE